MDKNLNIHITGSSADAERAIGRVDSKLQSLVQGLVTGFSTALFNRIFQGLEGIANRFQDLIQRGIEFNATVQDARLGIAAVIKQFDDTGAIKNFDQAIEKADEALKQLKIEAKQSPATLKELIQAFQGISGAALGAGISVTDTVSLVTLMSQALAGLGIRSDQILQESRALVTGNITEDAMAARILGITKAQIDQAKEQGKLYDFLTNKLGAFSEAATRGTRNYTTALSNLEDAVDAVMGEATEDLFDAVTKAILRFSDAVADPNFKDGLKPFIADLTKLIEVGADVGEKVIRNLDKVGTFYEMMSSGGGRSERNGVFENVFGAIIEDNPLAVVSRAAGRYTAFWEEYYRPTKKSGSITVGEAAKESAEAAKKAIPEIESLTAAQEKLVKAISGEFDKLGVDDAGLQILDFMAKSEDLKKAFTKPNDKALNETEKAAYEKAQAELEAVYLDRVHRIKDAEKESRAETLEAEGEFLDQLKAESLSYSDDRKAIIEAETELLKEHIRSRITDAEKLQEALAIADRIREERLRREIEQVYELSDAYERFAQRSKESLLSLQSAWSDLGTNVSDVALNGIQSAVKGVGDTIGDAIYTTANWERTFARVSQSIVRSLINVVVEYVAQMLVVRTMRRIMDTEQVASAGVRAAAEAPAAAAASIGSWGAAAAVGVAALLAGLAVGIAAFQEGGKVKGGKQVIQVNEQGEEFVLNARATAALGENFLNQLQSAAEAGQNMDQVLRTAPIYRGNASGSAMPNVNVSAPPVYVAVVSDQDAVIRGIQSQQGRKAIYQVSQEQAIALGIQT